jgi:hypothetical protein
MPGSVGNAAPATVLPKILCQQFSWSSEYPCLINEYSNGEFQSGELTTTARHRAHFTGRWTNSIRQALRAFYIARAGATEAFYAYNPWETDPVFTHDPTGADTVGRYTVRFEGPWQDALELGRSGAALELVEVA